MKHRILVVEDEPAVARGVRDALGFNGYSAEWAADGLTGYQLARTQALVDAGVDVVVFSNAVAEPASAAAEITGVARVLTVEKPEHEHALAALLAPELVELAAVFFYRPAFVVEVEQRVAVEAEHPVRFGNFDLIAQPRCFGVR